MDEWMDNYKYSKKEHYKAQKNETKNLMEKQTCKQGTWILVKWGGAS